MSFRFLITLTVVLAVEKMTQNIMTGVAPLRKRTLFSLLSRCVFSPLSSTSILLSFPFRSVTSCSLSVSSLLHVSYSCWVASSSDCRLRIVSSRLATYDMTSKYKNINLISYEILVIKTAVSNTRTEDCKAKESNAKFFHRWESNVAFFQYV